jgi:hypothetical protein
MCIESVEAVSSGHNPVILIMDLESYETTLLRAAAFTANFRNRRHPKNQNITLVEEIDVAITIITSTMRSAKKKKHPKLHHIYPLVDLAVPDLEELLRRKRKTKENMHNLKRAADRRQYNFL